LIARHFQYYSVRFHQLDNPNRHIKFHLKYSADFLDYLRSQIFPYFASAAKKKGPRVIIPLLNVYFSPQNADKPNMENTIILIMLFSFMIGMGVGLLLGATGSLRKIWFK
jgi:hypothetical protein